jgi:hypothetical protein
VFAGASAGVIVAGVFEVLHQYWPAIQVPSPATVALIVTILSTVAAYFAKHTARPGDLDEPLADLSDQVRKLQAAVAVRPAVQLQATTTGTTNKPGGAS